MVNASVYVALGGLAITYAFVSFFILPMFSTQQKYLSQQEWVGVEKGFFARFRAGMAAIKNTPALVKEGYSKYSKNQKVFVLPQFSRDPFVVLPADKVMEFLNKGDDRVDHNTIGRESIAHKWTIGKNFESAAHFDVVRRQLTRKLPQLTADVYAELVMAMEQQWSPSTEWKTVNIYPTAMKIVSQAANRVFSGKVLCRNPQFLESSRIYAQETFKSGALLKLIPNFLHTIFAPLIVRECRRHFNICKSIAAPIIEDRIHRMRTQGKAYEPANDVLQWILDDAFEAVDQEPYRLTTDWLCSCLLLLNMVAIHTTSMVTTNTLLDLYSAPNRDELVAGLREEAERVLTISKGEWSKEAVNSLLRTDSVIRETMRVTSLGELGLPRVVADPNGITLSGGIHLPQGVRVIMPTHSIQTDEERYGSNAGEWDGFRFSRPHEEFLASAAGKVSGDAGRLDKVLEHKNRGLIVTSDDFFTFGAVRHACPGRFFASQEIKLMMAYIVMNFDFKVDGGRPANFSFNGASVPTDDMKIDIRLRAR